MAETMGEFLRRWRKRAKLSQTTAAELAGVHLSTLWRWENGEVQPRMDEFMRLMDAYDVPNDERLGWAV